MANTGQVAPSLLVHRLAEWLAISSFGVGTGAIFEDVMPNSPVVCLAVISEGGPRLRGDPLTRPGIRVLVRDASFVSAQSRAAAIWRRLDTTHLVFSGVQGRFDAENPPNLRYPDSNNRWVFALNFSFTGLAV